MLARETDEQLKQRESMEIVEVGKELGWENESMDFNKVQDVELLFASGYDYKYVLMHHRVRALLEANAVYGDNREIENINVFQKLAAHEPLNVRVKATGGAEERDLRDYAYLMDMKRINRFLGGQRLTDGELEQKFWDGEKMEIEHTDPDGKTKTVDLWELAKYDDMSDFDYADYVERTRKYQVGLQWLGNLRTQAIKNHHGENAGHVWFEQSGFTKRDGRKEYLWLPVCPHMAMKYVNADKQKTSKRFRAEGHVHEVAEGYDENTSCTIGFSYEALRAQRQDIGDYQSHSGTNKRMHNAAIGLAPDEDIMRAGGKVARDGVVYELDAIVDIGNRGKGQIFTALRNHHDRAAQEYMGRKLTDDEISDLIITDIIAPFLANNSSDWLMCMAKATGVFKGEGEAIRNGDWQKKYGFCLRIRCKDVEKSKAQGEEVFEDKIFLSADELFDYVNSRIEAGEVLGVTTKVMPFKPAAKEQAEESPTDTSGMEGEETLSEEGLRAGAEVFRNIFVDDQTKLEKALKEYRDSDDLEDIKVETSVGTRTLKEFLEEKLKNYNGMPLMTFTGENSMEAARIRAIEILENLDDDGKKQLLEFAISLKSS